MLRIEKQYLKHLEDLLELGGNKADRTGTGTKSIFGHQMKCDLRRGFPLLTTKKVFFSGIVNELLWFLTGDTNVKYLQDRNVKIWDQWAADDGSLGPVYGQQWRKWRSFPKRKLGWDNEIDQISGVIEELKTNPDSRRLIVSAWNVGQLSEMALPPCHMMFQFNSVELLDERGLPQRYLDIHMYQRSADWFLGVPFNIASYSLLLMMVAQQVDMLPRMAVFSYGDTHLYNDHEDQAREQLSRPIKELPLVVLHGKRESIDDYELRDFELVGYDPHPAIKAEVSV